MPINKILNSSTSILLLKKPQNIILASSKISVCPQMLQKASECLDTLGRAQVNNAAAKKTAPEIHYLKQILNNFRQNNVQISKTKQDVIKYLEKISKNLEEKSLSSDGEELTTVLAKKAVVDYLVEHVDYNADFRAGQVGFEFGLPAKKISNNLADFEEEFNRSVSAFKREGILTLSDYDPKNVNLIQRVS